MPVKFKLGFTIDGETLFGILSKFLPISDVTVEEIVEPPLPMEDRVNSKMQQLAKIVAHSQPLRPAKVKQIRRSKGSGYALRLHAGMNAIIMATFADGNEHVGSDCFPTLRAATYSTNGLYGKLQRLKLHGFLMQPRPGYWKITQKGKERWEQPPAKPQENAA